MTRTVTFSVDTETYERMQKCVREMQAQGQVMSISRLAKDVFCANFKALLVKDKSQSEAV